MDKKLIIRPYRKSDRAAVIIGCIDLQETEHAISEFCLPGKDVGERYLDLLIKLNSENSGLILVAEFDEKIVGFISCRIETDESVTTTENYNIFGYISDAWTDREYRKQGIFRALNDAAIQYLKGLNRVTVVKLNVIAKNKAAIAAYENTGYKIQELTLVKKI